MDFEMAMIRAFELELQGASVFECYFHFDKSLWRKIQDLGVSADYRNSRNLKKTIRMVMSVGFLSPLLVRMNFLNLRNRNRTARLIARFPALGDFFDYVEQNYIDGINFPIAIWNVYARPIEFRTNNYVESFHQKWKATVNVAHPSLWRFIDVLKNEHAVHENKV